MTLEAKRIANEGAAEDDVLWTVHLDRVERLTSDDPADDGTLFAVEFTATGPSMNAEFEVLVSDIADEAQVVVEALDALQDGLETLTMVLSRRPGAGKVEPKGG